MGISPQSGQWTIEFNIDQVLQPVSLEIDAEVYIGRAQPDQLVFSGLDLAPYKGEELGVSRHHAVIRVRGSALMIADLYSAHGTRLNGTRLEPDVEYKLTDGDQLGIGFLKMIVHLKNNLGWSSILGQRVDLNLHNAPIKGRGQRVLIVEDDKSFSNLYRMTLELGGYSVQVCHDVVSAIRVLNLSSPALILLDLMLGAIHGLELCRYVRRDIDNPTMPIVVISGASGETVQQALDAGADVYVGKPTNIKELAQVVAFLIHKSETENPRFGTKELIQTAPLKSLPSPVIKNGAVIFIEGGREPLGITIENQILLGRGNKASSTANHNVIDLDRYGAFDKGVSRTHARLTRMDSTFQIEDLGSSNGTYVNGKSLKPYQPTVINPSDEIRLAELRMRIYFVDESNPGGSLSKDETRPKTGEIVK